MPLADVPFKGLLMYRNRVTEIFNKLPQLEKHFGTYKSRLTEARSGCMDTTLLNITTGRFFDSEERGYTERDIFFLDKEGNIISRVGFEKWYHVMEILRFYFFGLFLKRRTGRSVREALRKLGERAKLCVYAVGLYREINLFSMIVLIVPEAYGSVFALFEMEKQQIAKRDGAQVETESLSDS